MGDGNSEKYKLEDQQFVLVRLFKQKTKNQSGKADTVNYPHVHHSRERPLFRGSPSRRSAWPAALCRRCTPCTCCRHSGSSSGAPPAPQAACSSLTRCTLPPGCRSPPSCLKNTRDARQRPASQSRDSWLSTSSWYLGDPSRELLHPPRFLNAFSFSKTKPIQLKVFTLLTLVV